MKTVGGVTTQFRYDGDNTIAETVGASTKTVLNGFGIDERYARDDAGGRRYFLTDLLGSTQALTDPMGNLATRYRYEAYGEVAIENVAGPASINAYQYTGRENDATGAYFYRARYYRPGAMRFIAEDPLEFVDGPNAYAYVAGDPLTFRDPLGLYSWGEFGGDLGNGVVGFGDALGAGGIRGLFGIYGTVDYCSDSYRWGKIGGIVFGLVPPFLRGAAAVGGMGGRAGLLGGLGRWMNHGRRVRLGPGRWPKGDPFGLGPSPNAPRLALGRSPGNFHFDLRTRLPPLIFPYGLLFPPPVEDDCQCRE